MKYFNLTLAILFCIQLTAQSLVFNEILFDPPDGVVGDANGDGTRSISQDEFIEFVNNSNTPLDISGYKIFDVTGLDSDTPRHIVPNNTSIPANGVFVVFGGGTPQGISANIIQTASSGSLSLANTNEVITVKNASDVTVLTFDVNSIGIDSDENQSIVRDPNITGPFALHISVTGTPFSSGDLATINLSTTTLILNEVLFDPPNGDDAGDANGDGSRDSFEDEFIEFVNNSDIPLDISGYTIFDESAISDNVPRHTVPDNTIVPAHSKYVVFGGGTPANIFGSTQVHTATSGVLALDNTGDSVIVKNNASEIIILTNSRSIGLDFGNNQSIARNPDVTGPFVLHSTASSANGALFSPAATIDGTLSNTDFQTASIRAYPNPVLDDKIHLRGIIGEVVLKAKIYDITGRKLIDINIINNQMDVSSLRKGIYMVEISSKRDSSIFRMIIE